MVFQPKYAAYLNLIEPWWKTLRALALAGRRFETWDEVAEAVDQATDYWNAHRHATPSSGDEGAATAPVASRASRSCRRPHDLPDAPLSDRRSVAQLRRQIDEVARHHVPRLGRREIGGLARPMLLRARDEAGA